MPTKYEQTIAASKAKQKTQLAAVKNKPSTIAPKVPVDVKKNGIVTTDPKTGGYAAVSKNPITATGPMKPAQSTTPTQNKPTVGKKNTPTAMEQAPTEAVSEDIGISDFGKMPSLTGYESEAGLTPEMLLTDQAREIQKTEEALFGKSQLDIKTGENLYTIQAKKKQEADAKALKTMEQEAAMAKSQEQEDFQTMKKQEQAGSAAITASTAGGREGIVSAGNQSLGRQVNAESEKRIKRADQQIMAAQQRRDQIMEDLKAAQASGNLEAAQSYHEALAQAQNQLMDADAARAQAVADANQQGIDMIKQITDISAGMSGAFAQEISQLSVPDIQSIYGLDSATAAIFKTSALNKAAIDPNDPDYRKKMAEADEAEQNALFAGMTTEQKNFEYYKQMMAYDPEGAKQFAQAAGLNEQQSFFANFNQQFNAEQANAQKVYEATGVKVPIKSKYAYDVTPDGSVSLERSAPAGTRPARGQCGAFVNDILGGGLVKDSWASKKALVNSQVPIAGCAFMENTGPPWGHTGFVEKVYKDENGKITGMDIRESNYVATETVSVAHIAVGDKRWNRIVGPGGFFIPGANRAKDQTVGGELAGGLDPSQSTGTGNAMLDQFAQAFADKTYDVADLKAMGMNPSDIAMVSAAALGKKKEVDTSDYETYAQAFAQGDLSLSDLKTLGVPEEYLGKIAAYGIQNKGLFDSGGSSVPNDELNIFASQLASGKISPTNLKDMGYNENQIKQIQLQSSQVSPTTGGGLTKEQADNYVQLKNQYKGRPEIEEYKKVQSAYSKLKAASPTAAGDLSLIFSYMKMLDPGSVVKEAEFNNAENAASLLDRYGLDNKLTKVWNGTKLTEAQRADFLKQAENIYKSSQSTYDKTVKEFANDAKIIGLPDDIAYSLGSGLSEPSTTGQSKSLLSLIGGFFGGGKAQQPTYDIPDDGVDFDY